MNSARTKTSLPRGVDVIVVNPVDSSATAQMTKLIKDAKIPA